MATWKETITRIGHSVETHFDHLRYRLKNKLGYDQPLQIVPYLSYGNQETLILRGRVLEQKDDLDSKDEESTWNNLVDSYQRFASDEIPHLNLNIQVDGQQVAVVTDEEGYFKVSVPTPASSDVQTFWHDFDISAPPQDMLEKLPEPVKGLVCIPHPECDIAIVSDIDDTIVVTDANNLLTMARLTFLESPASRLPFAGVGELYQALTQGGKVQRPIFYVSSSPWNLYDFLVDFMRINQIPLGPLFLRDWGLHADGMKDHKEHKTSSILSLMDMYPNLNFILIGDSGQKDPEAFSTILAEKPTRIKAIYIRDVSSEEARDEQVEALAAKAQQQQVDMLLVADSLMAAEHAASKGYIRAEAVNAVRNALLKNDPQLEQIEQAIRP